MMKINPSHEIVAWAYCQTWDSELTHEEHEALVRYFMSMNVQQTIPDRWFAIGKCVRQTTTRQTDGSRLPSQTEEWFLTFKLPWKRRMYSISMDEFISGHPRFIVRFKFGWVL